jgi:hypothetical protein
MDNLILLAIALLIIFLFVTTSRGNMSGCRRHNQRNIVYTRV